MRRAGPEECWLWQGAVTSYGHGQIRVRDGWNEHRMMRAHRVAYELLVGPIPDGLVLDHLCEVPGCVNPAHLEPVLATVNLERTRKPLCRRGHPMEDTGKRQVCRVCAAARRRGEYR